MPEIPLFIDERYSKFTAPSKEERKFREENPRPDWLQLINHLLDAYDPRLWRLEGGAAIAFYHPGRRVVDDIDIFTPSEEFAEQFGLPPWKIDVRTTEQWLRFRNLPATKKNMDYLMSAHVAKILGERRILVSAPSVIAFSKRYTYDAKGPRDKDLKDLALLAETPTRIRNRHIEKVHRILKAA